MYGESDLGRLWIPFVSEKFGLTLWNASDCLVYNNSMRLNDIPLVGGEAAYNTMLRGWGFAEHTCVVSWLIRPMKGQMSIGQMASWLRVCATTGATVCSHHAILSRANSSSPLLHVVNVSRTPSITSQRVIRDLVFVGIHCTP
jgi:hypothetical protein